MLRIQSTIVNFRIWFPHTPSQLSSIRHTCVSDPNMFLGSLKKMKYTRHPFVYVHYNMYGNVNRHLAVLFVNAVFHVWENKLIIERMSERMADRNDMFLCKTVRLQQWLIICAWNFYFAFGFVATLFVSSLHRNSCAPYVVRPMHKRILHIILIWLAGGWIVCAISMSMQFENWKSHGKNASCSFISTPPHFCVSTLARIGWCICRNDWVSLQFLLCSVFSSSFAAIFYTHEMIATEGNGCIISKFYVFYGCRKQHTPKKNRRKNFQRCCKW